MRIILFSTLALFAFAANSVLNRAALSEGLIGPAGFAAVRVASALAMLAILLWFERRKLPALTSNWMGPLGLLIYILGFSFAYLHLNTGFGALLLFGAVQIAMFIASRLRGVAPTVFETGGAVIAFGGLVYLLLPNLTVGGVWPSLMMVAAGIGWAMFSVSGQSTTDALGATASSFAIILIPVCAVWVLVGSEPITTYGVLLACLSGALTSALGYQVWYTVLPKIPTTTAAVVQLTVPIIAIIAGIVLLGEPSDVRVWVSSIIVILGVLISLFARKMAK